jgi:hypothetical protein
MTSGRIQDPEGAKTIVVSFKTVAGTITSIQRQTLRIVCFSDKDNGRVRIDMASIVGGKHSPSLKGRRLMLIYKTYMQPEASMNPEQCTSKSNVRAMNNWLMAHIKSIDRYEEVYSPELQHGGDT